VLKKSILYFLLFLLCLSMFLLFKAPARVIWDQTLAPNASVQSALRSIGLKVEGLEGTIWDGRVLLQYQGISSILDWRMSFAEIYRLNLPVDIAVDSQAGRLSALLNAGVSGLDLHVSKANVDLSVLTPALRRQRVTLDGELLVKDLRVVLSEEKVQHGSGLMSWTGGNIAYPAQRAIHERSLPAFKVTVETRDDGIIHAGVRDSGGVFDVLEASLSPEGEAFAQVKRRLLDLADEHWPKNSSEKDTVFKVKKMIY
jgi:general secretion pathway protein N